MTIWQAAVIGFISGALLGALSDALRLLSWL